jgi:hypothetical protein
MSESMLFDTGLPCSPNVCECARLKTLVTDRRFPPPWSVEEAAACFVVVDSAGQKLAYVYFEDEPGRAISSQVAAR